MDLLITAAPAELLLTFACVALAYVVFGLFGFGTALIAAPLLSHWMTVSMAISLLAILDLAGASYQALSKRHTIAKDEFFRIAPMMLLGIALGSWGLVQLPKLTLMWLLGIFVSVYGLWRALPREKTSEPKLASGWGYIFGLCGGICGALFGSGGFLYALYLSRRLCQFSRQGIEQQQGTQHTLISLSALIRVSVLTSLGAYQEVPLTGWLCLLLPAMMLGLWGASQLGRKLPRQRYVQLLNYLLITSGVGLMAHALR